MLQQQKQGASLDAVSESRTMTEAESKAKWGFLKNIINIHTFFDAGDKEKKTAASLAQKKSIKNKEKTTKAKADGDMKSQKLSENGEEKKGDIFDAIDQEESPNNMNVEIQQSKETAIVKPVKSAKAANRYIF